MSSVLILIFILVFVVGFSFIVIPCAVSRNRRQRERNASCATDQDLERFTAKPDTGDLKCASQSHYQLSADKDTPSADVGVDPTQSSPTYDWLKHVPTCVAFLDTETTGLTEQDRVVTLAVILMDVPALREAQLKVSLIHRIYNPGIACHPAAARVHGHDDWELRHQPPFIEEAKEISDFIRKASLIICHNARFDISFLNREMIYAKLPPITTESFCTMERYRRLYGGSVSLQNVISQLGMTRSGTGHGALEDAWLTMNVFLYLNDVPIQFPFSALEPEQYKLQNLRVVPPKFVKVPKTRQKQTRKRSLDIAASSSDPPTGKVVL